MAFTIDNKTDILAAIFVAALVTANLLGNKMTEIIGITASVGIFAFPLTFLVTDIIEEVHGKEKTRSIVNAGIISLAIVFIILAISTYAPAASFWKNQEAFELIHGQTLRIIFASFVAFAISQYHDLWAFNFWKQKTRGKFLWLRNNASTIVSTFIDTVIFTFIAFYQVTPDYNIEKMFALIIPYWTLKVLLALGDTPLCYLGVRWLKK